jgi:two-component system response regulator QseB
MLLVEDDELLGDGVRAGLAQAGFAVDWVRDGREAATALALTSYDAVVLDLGIPGWSGLELLGARRAVGDPTPVLILTARDTVADRVAGLDKGADDYLVKPFDLDELLARLRALVRRSAGRAAPELRDGDLVLDPASRQATLDGAPVELSPRELALLEELLRHPGEVRSRAQLEERLYGWGEEIASNAVEVHVHNLRRKLGADRIRTVRGAGYTMGRRAGPR